MTEAELLAVLGDVLELGEPVPLELVPLLHAVQADAWQWRGSSGSESGPLGVWGWMEPETWSGFEPPGGSWSEGSETQSNTQSWPGSWSETWL